MGCGGSKPSVAAGPPPPPPKMYAFRVKVLGGLNLYNNEFGVQLAGTKTSKFKFDCKPNSYVELSVEDQTRSTRNIRWEVNPVFNEEFIFTCNSRKPTLKITVYDQLIASEVGKVISGKGAIIGQASLNLHGLLGKEEREMWVQLKDSKGKGELGIIVQEAYRTTVTVVAGHNLTAADSFSNTSDVYMSLQVGQQTKFQTSVKSWTVNPRWENEKFDFYIPYGKTDCYLQCLLWDKDLVSVDTPMGWFILNFNGSTNKMDRDELSGQIKATKVRLPVRNDCNKPAGEIELVVGVDTVYQPDCADPGPVKDSEKALWPPSTPQTATFEVRCIGAFNLCAGDSNGISNAVETAANEFVFNKYKQATGSSDPFLRVECEGVVYDTPRIPNTLNPSWNEAFKFVCRNKHEAILKLGVYDHDFLSENDRLGQTTLPCSLLKAGEEVQVWGSLDRGARGEVGVILVQAFQIKARVIACSDLPSKDLNGMSDPFVRIAIEDAWHQTRVVSNDRNPIFDEDFRWAITRIGPDTFLNVEVFDSDFALFNKQVTPDLLGSAKWCLNDIIKGQTNKLNLELKDKNGAPAGKIRIDLLDELPLPPSISKQLEDLGQKGQEAIEAARVKLAAESKQFFRILSPANEEAKQEAVVEPADNKITQRPRYSRFKVVVLACRGLVKKAQGGVYVAVVSPAQGCNNVQKTPPRQETTSPDFGEEFDVEVPTRTYGGVQFYIFDAAQVPYTDSWTDDTPGKALYSINVPFNSLNKGEGPIRGSPGDDLWLNLEDGGKLVVRVEEDYRWQVQLVSIHTADKQPLSTDMDTPLQLTLQLGATTMQSNEVTIQKGEWLVAYQPSEDYTIFTRSKNALALQVFTGGEVCGEFRGFQELRRGIQRTIDIPCEVDPLRGGKRKYVVTVRIREEEKMALLDQLIDLSANALKLMGNMAAEATKNAAAAAADASKNAAAAATAAMGSIGGALGGLFGK